MLQSIEGIGPILALTLMVVTVGDTRLKNPRKLVCYAGVVPFEYSSGRQVSSRRKISHRANKALKKKLHNKLIHRIYAVIKRGTPYVKY
ncbi:transposase [Fodinibius saliphilus]|uniref:transposase n=1 Tax=Fodinibius saliphilus TaxID=1920650 RepID=UPI0014870C4D|nr:transposase [Fodinibius saliphilus]